MFRNVTGLGSALLVGPSLGVIFVYLSQPPDKAHQWVRVGAAQSCRQCYENVCRGQLKYKVVNAFTVHSASKKVTLDVLLSKLHLCSNAFATSREETKKGMFCAATKWREAEHRKLYSAFVADC